MGAMDRVKAIDRLIAPTLAGMGYALVRARLSGGDRRTLQVMAERNDGATMKVADCAEISRALSALLDVEDPITGTYDLEVSSPGIDRPLVRLEDFARFAGFDAKIETARPVDGRKRFLGRLDGVNAGRVRIDLGDGKVAALPYEDIREAKLVLTDELIAAHMNDTGGR